MFCSRCGSQLGEAARFCATCGAPIETAAQASERRKLVTILFADIAGSTAMGESLDPEVIRSLLSRHFAAIRGVLERHGGTVEKFIGDAVMAVFGIPEAHEDDALRAVRAAVELQRAIAKVNEDTSGGATVSMRVGVNSGEVVTGEGAAETLVTGDTVNTAARFEQAAEPGTILIGEATYRLVEDAVAAEPVPPLTLKGKAQPVPAYRVTSIVGAEGRRRHLEAPIVGRTQEMATLQAAWTEVVAGGGARLLTVIAPAGVGKSRLISELAVRLELQARVLAGRCLPYGDGITYWPIRGIVLAAAGVDEFDSVEVARDKIRALLNSQADGEALAEKVGAAMGLSDAPASQDEVFWAIRRTLETVATEPTLYIIEDLHWAEPTLLDVLQYLNDLAVGPMLLVLTARPELLETRPDWAALGGGASMMRIEALGATETDELLVAQAGGSAVPDNLKRRVLDAAEGNPLFIEEMVAMLREEEILVEEADGWHANAGSSHEVVVPTSIRALLSARLDRLPMEERVIAQRASVVGRSFEAAALSELAPDSLRGEVARRLISLVRKELLRPDRSELTSGDAFEFRHVLIRDAAYDMLPKTERAILHERFAAWLERVAGDRLPEFEEILAYHLEQAVRYRRELGQTDDAARLALMAGSHFQAAGLRADRRGDNAALIPLMTKAADLLEGHDRVEALLALGMALSGGGEHRRGQEILQTVREQARLTDDKITEHRARIRQLNNLIGSPEISTESIRMELEAGLAALGEEGWEVDRSIALNTLGSLSGNEDEARPNLEAALALSVSTGNPRGASAAAANLASLLLIGRTPVAEALAELERRSEAGSGGRRGESALLAVRGSLLAMLGRFDEGRALIQESVDICRDLRAVWWEIATQADNRAQLELLAGNEDGALAALEACEPLLEDAGPMRRSLAGVRTMVLAVTGHPDEAIALGNDYLAVGDEDVDIAAQVLAGMAAAHHLLGQLNEASRASNRAVQLLQTAGNLAYLGLALLERAAIRRDAGDSDWTTDIDLAEQAFGQKGHVVGLRRAEVMRAAAAAMA